ncbi:AlkZ-related protein [Paenibacillus alkalitolerans]|uniref:AlkZ-related protein n=1 Tax=Paenibacillus alkalitolerans TaxID=2799335 RepID=UPI0018F51016|nr:hypothetical protein [Paenibacillus alkalitolerans]
MKISNYQEFVQIFEKYKIFPFSDFVPEYPSLTAVAAHLQWHSGAESDPWLWRVRIVEDGVAAYGKFFGSKACFIHISLFPLVKTILTSGRPAEDRYNVGLMSRTAFHIYKILLEHGSVDSRTLRKLAGLGDKEHKKEYEKALVELQNYGDVVITGAKGNENDSGWSSMCYELVDSWISDEDFSISVSEAKEVLQTELEKFCTSNKSYAFFAKKLGLEVVNR